MRFFVSILSFLKNTPSFFTSSVITPVQWTQPHITECDDKTPTVVYWLLHSKKNFMDGRVSANLSSQDSFFFTTPTVTLGKKRKRSYHIYTLCIFFYIAQGSSVEKTAKSFTFPAPSVKSIATQGSDIWRPNHLNDLVIKKTYLFFTIIWKDIAHPAP